MNENVEILIATLDDACDISLLSWQVGKMHDEAMPKYFKPTSQNEHNQIICGMFKDEQIKIFKAVYQGVLCGFLCLLVPSRIRKGFVHARSGVVLNMGVDEHYRQKGIGTELLKNAEVYLQEQGINALELDVFMFNKNAQKLYEKMGFHPIEQHMFKSFSD